jgi:uncharacterized protein with NRDE domain
MLPAAPWDRPALTDSDRVGQAAASPVLPALGLAAAVDGLALDGAVLAGALGVTVTVLAGAAAGVPEPQPAANPARSSARQARAGRGAREDGVIEVFPSAQDGSASRGVSYDATRPRPVGTERGGPGGTVAVVCLLIALSRTVPGIPLLVAANRDELYARPAEAVTVLRGAAPRILGGRDELAGGTWLAVNAAGVLAGLTNQPSAGRDPAKRSRGELPLLFAAYPDAATAVAEVCGRLDPANYNPCWLLVGDRDTLFSVDLTGGPRPVVQELPPGRYVLENAPLRRESAKQQRVAALVETALAADGGAGAAAALATALRDHQPAAGPQPAPPGGLPRPAEISAACVHTERYGTRSAMIVSVPAAGLPKVQVAEGAPCAAPLLDQASLWTRAAPAVAAVRGGSR